MIDRGDLSTVDVSIDDTRSRRGERGQGLVEYAFIVMLVALLLILSVAVIGHQTNGMYSNVSNGLNVATGH